MNLREESVEYQDADVELRGLLVSDDHGDKRPGMLVVHGGAGLDDHARGRARQLAELGLLVFACDMYGTGWTGDRDRVMPPVPAMEASLLPATAAVREAAAEA